jgi:DNA end-binding protein Ku
MTRPTWTGHIQISLVSIGVKIFPASNPGRSVEFHQIDRESGHRIHHQNVADGEEIDRADVVKGFEYRKGKYVQIELDELKQLRIPTAKTMEIKQFVKTDEVPAALFDRPYFVAPQDDLQGKALAVMRKGLEQTTTMGIGEIAFAGREHLVAIAAPIDAKQKGLMLYTLRYAAELRDAKSVFSGIKDVHVEAKEVTLAKQIINGNIEPFELSAYKNDYEAAVRRLIDAKLKDKPLPREEPKAERGKVIDLMEALRQSVAKKRTSPADKRPARRVKAA